MNKSKDETIFNEAQCTVLNVYSQRSSNSPVCFQNVFTGGGTIGTINYTKNHASSSARNSRCSSLSDFNDIPLPHDINDLCNPMIVSSLADVDQIDSRPAVVDERNDDSSDSVMIDSEFRSVAVDYFKLGETLHIFE